MKISSITEAEKILHSFVSDASNLGDGQSLNRMWPLLQAVGNPQDKLKVIHVAGTSGKTSTSYFIASILSASGKKVGLTVSPHVDSITERVQIDGKPIAEVEFCSDLAEFLELIDNQEKSSYFEVLIVFILWEFVRYKVDYAVLETGMGGLLDGTNVVTREDKVCVITDIGYDHMHVLGNTLMEIAAQKAGIIHKNNIVFTNAQSDEVIGQFKERIEDKSAILNILTYKSIDLIAKNLQIPLFQRRNWAIAHEAVRFIGARDSFTLEDIDPSSVVVPARMESMKLKDGSTLVMDGAHNAQKMEAFIRSFQEKFPDEKPVVLLALKKGKEYEGVIDALKPVASKIIVTRFTVFQDLPFTAQDPETIAKYIKSQGINATAVDDYIKAYKQLQSSGGSVKIVTGSFYLLGQVRALLK